MISYHLRFESEADLNPTVIDIVKPNEKLREVYMRVSPPVLIPDNELELIAEYGDEAAYESLAEDEIPVKGGIVSFDADISTPTSSLFYVGPSTFYNGDSPQESLKAMANRVIEITDRAYGFFGASYMTEITE